MQVPEKPSYDLSCDGVAESITSNTTLNVWCVRFVGCRTYYPLRISKAYIRAETQDHEDYEWVVNQIM